MSLEHPANATGGVVPPLPEDYNDQVAKKFPSPSTKLRFRTIRGEIAYIVIRDTLTNEKTKHLRSLVEMLRANDYTRIVIDLSRIQHIHSATARNELARVLRAKAVEVVAGRNLLDELGSV